VLLDLLGPLQPTLDLVLALGVDLFELREGVLPQEPVEQEERDQTDDDLDRMGSERARPLRSDHECHEMCLLALWALDM
jgi:hypothetical protein